MRRGVPCVGIFGEYNLTGCVEDVYKIFWEVYYDD